MWELGVAAPPHHDLLEALRLEGGVCDFCKNSSKSGVLLVSLDAAGAGVQLAHPS